MGRRIYRHRLGCCQPFHPTNLPQIRLEPILRRRAEELAPGRVRFHHEVVDLRQDADAVTAKVVDHDDSSEPPQEQLESDQGGCEHDGKTTPLAGGRNRSPGPRETFINLFLASRRFTDEVERLCRDEQMAMSHYVVLWFLCRRPAPDGVPMGAVADGHLNRASDATRLADRLITLGYLERLPSPKDRRVVLVRITAAGRDVFVRLTRRIKALHREQWEQLETSELRLLNTLLAKALWGEGATASERHPLAADASST